MGWRGILPRNARGFARNVADTLTGKLLSARDLAEKLDPEDVERLFEGSVDSEMDAIARRAAELIRPGAWDALPQTVRDQLAEQLKGEVKKVAREIFDRLQGISDEVLDLRALIVTELSGSNTSKLVRLFQHIGSRELKFIEVYGGVFGFLIGSVQVAAWSVFQTWWLMPIVGVMTGLVTNWLALQMIFRPLEPTRYLGVVTFQGLFPKRQAQIAADYGRVAADEILTASNLIRLVTEGEGGQRIADIVVATISEAIDEAAVRAKKMAAVEVDETTIEAVKQEVVQRLTHAMPQVRGRVESYLDRKLDIGATVRTRLERLPKPEFERILRGLFERDEGILIVIGGVLGGLVGLLQGVIVIAVA